jgi:single-strand DNA-binding protein
MIGVNRVILIGNLGKDPEIRHLEHGRMKASFPLATDEIYTNKEGIKVVHTEWHNVVLWAKLAEVAAKYLIKGKQVYLEGRLSSRSYMAQDKQVKHITEVTGQRLILLGGMKDNFLETEKGYEDLLEEDMQAELPF